MENYSLPWNELSRRELVKFLKKNNEYRKGKRKEYEFIADELYRGRIKTNFTLTKAVLELEDKYISNIRELYNDVLFLIGFNLNYQNLINLCQTDKQMNKLCNNREFLIGYIHKKTEMDESLFIPFGIKDLKEISVCLFVDKNIYECLDEFGYHDIIINLLIYIINNKKSLKRTLNFFKNFSIFSTYEELENFFENYREKVNFKFFFDYLFKYSTFDRIMYIFNIFMEDEKNIEKLERDLSDEKNLRRFLIEEISDLYEIITPKGKSFFFKVINFLYPNGLDYSIFLYLNNYRLEKEIQIRYNITPQQENLTYEIEMENIEKVERYIQRFFLIPSYKDLIFIFENYSLVDIFLILRYSSVIPDTDLINILLSRKCKIKSHCKTWYNIDEIEPLLLDWEFEPNKETYDILDDILDDEEYENILNFFEEL